MEVVGAGFRGDKYGRTGAAAILCGVVVGQNLEFLNIIDRGKSSDTAGGQFVVVRSVQNPIRAIRTGPTDGKREGAPRRNLTACSLREKLPGFVSEVAPEVSVASCTKSRPFRGN